MWLVEPLSGGAGWMGAGLLGLVLGWLLFVHLPAKDKLIKDVLSEQRADFKERMQIMVATIHEDFKRLEALIREGRR